jgi:DNA-directed RNA polymerase subunit H (RpoH/RPB5)
MDKHKKTFEEHDVITKEEFKNIVTELDNDCSEVEQILKGYKIISELAQIVEDDRDTLEKKLKKKYPS